MTEDDQLLANNISKDTMAYWIYLQFRGQGLTTKEAIIKASDGINTLQSDSLPSEVLEPLKKAFFTIKGQWK